MQFLTRIPVQSEGHYSEARMAEIPRYFPLVGAIIGTAGAAVFLVTSEWLGLLSSVLISCAVTLALTGAFHEDGLADTFDGIGGGHSKARALEIMRDSRLGTYGTLAVVVALLLKVALLTELPPRYVPIALVLGHALSRLSSVLVLTHGRYVRDEGTGKPVAQGLSSKSMWVATVTAMAIAALAWLLIGTIPVMTALGMMLAAHALLRTWIERKIDGYTGDTLGSIQQASELGCYLGLALWL
ncbi:MAG: adenosylcobinamide-GDP ribazoletransferase [Pseudomonadota bacterium]